MQIQLSYENRYQLKHFIRLMKRRVKIKTAGCCQRVAPVDLGALKENN